jgi:hypothetical protein
LSQNDVTKPDAEKTSEEVEDMDRAFFVMDIMIFCVTVVIYAISIIARDFFFGYVELIDSVELPFSFRVVTSIAMWLFCAAIYLIVKFQMKSLKRTSYRAGRSSSK